MTTDQPGEWRKFYQAALLELEPAKLSERIEQAYAAIQLCMEEAGPNSSVAERQALADALANLRVLRREIDTQPMNAPNGPESSASNL